MLQIPIRGESMEGAQPTLDVSGLSIALEQDGGVIPITEDVSFSIARGEVLALVGESGSGKSVTALALMQLLGQRLNIAGGRILFSAADGYRVDIATLGRDGAEIEAIRGARMGMIFQEPMSSFSPIHTIGSQLAEVAQIHEKCSKQAARDRAAELLAKVGLPDPKGALDRYPSEFSGGMRQRAMIARALICSPSLLIADEPTTALDVTIQGQILDLLRKLQHEFGMAILFITHDLGIVAQMADRVAIMYAGRIVESAPVSEMFRHPAHPYTRALLEAVPRLGDLDRRRKIKPISGSVPNIFDAPTGCRFHPRCPVAELPRCAAALPPVHARGAHLVACIHGKTDLQA
jgi:peptide/nickel transport system ATP-binding protein